MQPGLAANTQSEVVASQLSAVQGSESSQILFWTAAQTPAVQADLSTQTLLLAQVLPSGAAWATQTLLTHAAT